MQPLDSPSSAPHRSRWCRLAFAAYDAGMWAVVTGVLAPAQRLAAIAGRSEVRHLRERLGRPPAWRTETRPRLLLHAVSVGEVAAAGALIGALIEERAAISIMVTTGTREGRVAAELLRDVHPQVEAVCYLPWDRSHPLRSWLRRLDPEAVIVVETEIWPGLFFAAADLAIPLCIVSGRMNHRDASRYRRARRVFRPVLACARWIGVRSELDRARFEQAVAPAGRVEVMGDLKHDVEPQCELPGAWSTTLARLQGAPLIVAGSTHHPEEGWLLEALLSVREGWPGARLVLAPRHPARARAVRRRAAVAGMSVVCWSDPQSAKQPWDVLVVDRIGVLAAIYRWADVAVIGGSLARRGGHNPLEAAAHGRPIVIGSSHEHFGEVVAGLGAAGGALVLPSGCDVRQALASALLELLGDPERLADMGRRALEYAQSQRGVARRYALRVLATLPAGNGHRGGRDGGAG